MTLEQAKKASEILQKIDRNREIINNLHSKITHDIRFGKGNNESTFIVCDKEFVRSTVMHCIHVLEQQILDLKEKLELL